MADARSRRWLLWSACAVIITASGAAVPWYISQRWHAREPYFHDNFSRSLNSSSSHENWQAYGGTWQVADGVMRNISDDRGAKLMNGDTQWHNYMISADVELLGETGDAGFVIRASQEEVGVDAYHGYFAGLRDLDDTLILGRADYGWHEFRAIPVRSGLATNTWYHLKVIAYECTIAVRATEPNGETTIASVHDPNCIQEGRFGLQSYSTSAAWRNVQLTPATASDLEAFLDGQEPGAPDAPPRIPAVTDLQNYQRDWLPMRRELRGHRSDLNALPIAQLRLLAPDHPIHVTVQGVVTLVSPTLFVQDSSGGVAIPNPQMTKPVEIGDEVEATGDANLHNFSSVLRDATIRSLWSHATLPPVAVTAAQAATGAFEAQFIETEGRIESEQHTGKHMVVLRLHEGSQSFLAIANNPSPVEEPHGFQIGSRLRLRGICVTDRAYTGDELPFALLMRSVEDAQVIEPPPWWNTEHIAELVAILFLLSLGGQLVFTSVKRSQFRAVVEERERLAMEMHDTLAQSFAGLGFQLEALCDEAPPGSAMRAQLESTLDLVRFGHMEARRNIAALRPSTLERLGLAEALRQAAHAIVREGKVAVIVNVCGEVKSIPMRLADPMFRIGQEAIANATRHGHPRRIDVRLAYGKSSVKLSIKDDGIGFLAPMESTGYGIRGMKRRADTIGANLRIHSLPGHGTSVRVRVMLPKPLLNSWWQGFPRNAAWREWLHGKAV
jgi:signal transduction histidine kinase